MKTLVMPIIIGVFLLIICPILGYFAKKYLDKHPVDPWGYLD